jgi:hypothetical protein
MQRRLGLLLGQRVGDRQPQHRAGQPKIGPLPAKIHIWSQPNAHPP